MQCRIHHGYRALLRRVFLLWEGAYAGYKEWGVLGIFNTIVPIGTIINGTEGTLAAISAGDYRAAGKTGIQTLLIAVATAVTLGEGATALAGGKGAGTAAIGQAENAVAKRASYRALRGFHS